MFFFFCINRSRENEFNKKEKDEKQYNKIDQQPMRDEYKREEKNEIQRKKKTKPTTITDHS